MCNTIDALRHTEINRKCKRTMKGYKVFRKRKSGLYPSFCKSFLPFKENKFNHWNPLLSDEDGFCFFPRKKDAVVMASTDSRYSLKKIEARNVLATYMTKEVISRPVKVGICKEFRILEEVEGKLNEKSPIERGARK